MRQQLAVLRSCISPDTAVIFTIRTVSEGGEADFSDKEPYLKMKLLALAKKQALHYIDVERFVPYSQLSYIMILTIMPGFQWLEHRRARCHI